MTLLAIIKLANDGLLLWSTVGPIIQQLIASGATGSTPVSMDVVEQLATDSQTDINTLQAAIDAKNAAAAGAVAAKDPPTGAQPA